MSNLAAVLALDKRALPSGPWRCSCGRHRRCRRRISPADSKRAGDGEDRGGRSDGKRAVACTGV
eukprot:6023619-Prymnesium_polylepis.2